MGNSDAHRGTSGLATQCPYKEACCFQVGAVSDQINNRIASLPCLNHSPLIVGIALQGKHLHRANECRRKRKLNVTNDEVPSKKAHVMGLHLLLDFVAPGATSSGLTGSSCGWKEASLPAHPVLPHDFNASSVHRRHAVQAGRSKHSGS
eukprot:1156645-Pelagomonas_calceolata.AAC.8